MDSGEPTRKKHTMRGMIFYYPHTSARESRPSLRAKAAWEGDDLEGSAGVTGHAAGAAPASPRGTTNTSSSSSSRARPSMAAPLPSDLEQQSVLDDVFSVFWGDRLVPETEMRSLPFFPRAKTRLQCESAQLPENWAGRIKGFLFLDWEFKHIQNNKLQIKIPDFEYYLREQEKFILYRTNATTEFLK